MPSDTDVANVALRLIGSTNPITSLTDGSDNAKVVNAIYTEVRDDLLRSHPWNFATKRVKLSRLSTDPTFEFDFAYALPTDWAQIGNSLSIATVGDPALAVLNGTDVAFIDATNDSLRTYRFDGTDWAQIGNSLAIATVGSPALAALNSRDVAFIDDSNDSIRTYRFDGTDWAQVGNSLAIATVGNPALTALNGTDIAFIDSTNDSLRTYRFDGTDWAQVGNSFAITTVGRPSITRLTATDIAFIDSTNDSLRTYRFTSPDWAQTGNSLSITTVGNPALAALNSTDVAFIDGDNDALRTYRFTSPDWAQTGNSLSIAGIGNPALAALNGTDIAFIDATNDSLRTYRYGDWLRTISVHDNDAGHGTVLSRHEQVDGKNAIVSSADAIYLRYISRVTDPNLMSADFRRALALSLARDLAIPLASSNTMQEQFAREVTRVLARARSADAMGSFPELRPRGSWAASRGGFRRDDFLSD